MPTFGDICKVQTSDGSESRLGIDSTLGWGFLEGSDSISQEESILRLDRTQSCDSVKTQEFFRAKISQKHAASCVKIWKTDQTNWNSYIFPKKFFCRL